MFEMKSAKGNHVVTKKVLDLEFCFYKRRRALRPCREV